MRHLEGGFPNPLTQSTAVRGHVRDKQLFAQRGEFYTVASIIIYTYIIYIQYIL